MFTIYKTLSMCRIASFAIVGVSVSWRLLRLSNSNMIVNKDNTHIRTFLMLSKRFVTANVHEACLKGRGLFYPTFKISYIYFPISLKWN